MRTCFLFVLLFLLIISCSTTQYTPEIPDNVQLPKKILFIAQSGTQESLFQTVIDLENNELVVLEYSQGMLLRVYRTSIILDPDDYKHKEISQTDAPFADSDIASNKKNTDETSDNDNNPDTVF